jgi:histidinol-phosphate/aromatic aminotransferase/cobyric acid decarboxylase-like protein
MSLPHVASEPATLCFGAPVVLISTLNEDAHEVIAAQLMDKGIEIARAFPPFDHWVRISIGLPAENLRARDAIEKLLG